MAVTAEEQKRFSIAVELIKAEGAVSIGTQGEKPIHRALKYFLAPSSDCHEVRVGNFIADVMLRDGHIYEVQTRDFSRLRNKLQVFLPEHRVTVVFPVFGIKYLSWIRPETGEISERRKSPKRGRVTDILTEIYRLNGLENHPNLDYLAVLLEAQEYRIQDGWNLDGKKGSHRYSAVPLNLLDLIPLKTGEDFAALIKEMLPAEGFVSKEAQKPLGLRGLKLSAALQSLCRLGAIERLGQKQGRSFLYRVK